MHWPTPTPPSDSPPSPSVRQVGEISPALFFYRLDSIINRAPVDDLKTLLARCNQLRAKLGGPPPQSSWSPEFHDAVASGFTEGMGGSLTPEDTPGGGLTMVISLPLAAGLPEPETE